MNRKTRCAQEKQKAEEKQINSSINRATASGFQVNSLHQLKMYVENEFDCAFNYRLFERSEKRTPN